MFLFNEKIEYFTLHGVGSEVAWRFLGASWFRDLKIPKFHEEGGRRGEIQNCDASSEHSLLTNTNTENTIVCNIFFPLLVCPGKTHSISNWKFQENRVKFAGTCLAKWKFARKSSNRSVFGAQCGNFPGFSRQFRWNVNAKLGELLAFVCHSQKNCVSTNTSNKCRNADFLNVSHFLQFSSLLQIHDLHLFII